MPEINPILQKERARRAKIVFVITGCLALANGSLSLFWMLAYNISYYIAIPFVILYTTLCVFLIAITAATFIATFTSLTPIEEDRFNPINRAIDLKEDTRIAVTMPVYHEDARRVAGAFSAMIEELSRYKEAKHFDWFILSDSRKEDVIVQEQKAVFLLKEKFPEIGIHYRHRIMNTFAKVGNTSDFFRRWGGGI